MPIEHPFKNPKPRLIYHRTTSKKRIFNTRRCRFVIGHIQLIIKQGVIIGINAAVLGPVVLGEGCQVGANAVVTKDVPAKAIVVSNNKIINV